MRRAVRSSAGVMAWMALAGVGGCLPFPGSDPAPVRLAEELWGEYVVSQAARPAAVAFAGDGRVFYVEQHTGQVRVVVDDEVLATPFVSVPVNTAGDRGLLGIALHPEFSTTPRVYICYTRSDTGANSSDPQAVVDQRVVYFAANGNVAQGGEVFVASFPATGGTQRVGGRLGFSADGKLLVALGDTTDTAGAQRDGTLLGKLLRYEPDGSIPADNPAADSPVFAKGLRNPRGVCVDPVNGGLFVIDECGSGLHEVNLLVAGADLGWPSVVGKAEDPAELEYVADHPDYLDPLRELATGTDHLAGASFNPSTRYGPLPLNDFFYGASAAREVRQADVPTDRTRIGVPDTFASYVPGDVLDVAFTPAGTLYVATESALLRVVPRP